MTPQELEEMGLTVAPLVWESDKRSSYASTEIGLNFTAYYSVSDTGEYGLWVASFGVHCHEFGETEFWKGMGRDAGLAACAAHNAARIAWMIEVTP